MKKYFFALMIGITVLLSAFEAFAANTWTMTGPMNNARLAHTATIMPNGKILVAGGCTTNCATALTSVELYDLATGTWKVTGSLNVGRCAHTATLLPNGKILVTGGKFDGKAISSAELYDPITGTWTNTGSLNAARHYHTATLLQGGKILVAGGRNNDFIASAELYDPSTGTWTYTGSMNTARWYHTATLLPSGKVLVAAGEKWRQFGSNEVRLNSAELYEPSTGTWTNTGSLNAARHTHSATLLPSGKVLIAGGWNSPQLTSAELYDPSAGTWTNTGSLNTARNCHPAALLPNGKVLVAGGNHDGMGNLTSAEIYDPATSIWTYTNQLNNTLSWHTATLLTNGKVLVAGGQHSDGSASTDAELYDPGIAPPIVREVTKAGIEDAELTFATSDFTNHFSDPSSGSLTKVKIMDLPTHGTLKLSETDVTVNQEIPVANLNNLKFIPETNWNGTTSFNWNGSNGTEYAVTPAKVNIIIEATEDRPILGMVTKTGTEGNTITFSASDFSNSFIDPDGFGLKKIKITSLPDCYGSLKLLNEGVKEGDEIPINYLENLTFVPDPNWKSETIIFNWNGSNGKLYAIRDGEVSITITDNSWWKPWIGGGAIGAATAIGTGYFTYKVNKYCHRHSNNNELLEGESAEIEMKGISGYQNMWK